MSQALSTKHQAPRLGFSVGDLAGIGPEVIYKTLLDERILKLCTPVVYGTATALFDEFPVAKDAEPLAFRQLRDAADIAPGRLNAVTCWDEDFHLAPGQPSAASGQAARESLLAASRDLKAGLLDGLVTAPISKEKHPGARLSLPRSHRVPDGLLRGPREPDAAGR